MSNYKKKDEEFLQVQRVVDIIGASYYSIKTECLIGYLPGFRQTSYNLLRPEYKTIIRDVMKEVCSLGVSDDQYKIAELLYNNIERFEHKRGAESQKLKEALKTEALIERLNILTGSCSYV